MFNVNSFDAQLPFLIRHMPPNLLIPASQVLAMLATTLISNHVYTQTMVQAAATAGLTAGAAAGSTAAFAAARPRLMFNILQLPFRLVYAPFYFMSGQHKMHAFLQRSELALTEYLNSVRAPWSQAGDIQITASPDYIAKVQTAVGGTGNVPSIDVPALSVSHIVTPDGQTASVLVLDQTTTRLIFVIALTVGSYILYRIFVVMFKLAIRSMFHLIKAIREIVREEQARDDETSKPTFR